MMIKDVDGFWHDYQLGIIECVFDLFVNIEAVLLTHQTDRSSKYTLGRECMDFIVDV